LGPDDVSDVDQLVFGYDQGHRILAGSRSLGRQALTRLLGATDASPADDNDILVTGLPLPHEGLYALSATWTAPEITRPGAVWAHVLLADFEAIGQAQEPMSLRSLIRRPTPDTLADYDVVLSWSDNRADFGTPPDEVLRLLVAAEYSANDSKVVRVDNLQWAEAAFGLIWRTQWPALRISFEFRTRDVARVATAGQALVATRRIQGKRPAARTAPERWADVLASSLVGGAPRQLPTFLRLFGPEETASTDAAVALTEIYQHIDRGDAVATARALEQRYPTKEAGLKLKADLFGQGDDLWHTPERDRVLAVVGSSVNAWPVETLNLSPRLTRLISSEGFDPVVRALAESTPADIDNAVVESLVSRADPADVAALAASHLGLVVRWLHAQPEIGDSNAPWRSMDAEQVHKVLVTLAPARAATVVAVVRAGHGDVAIDAYGLDVVLHALADQTQLDLTRDLIRQQTASAVDRVRDPQALLAILAVAPKIVDTSAARDALIQTRPDPNELWLRAAVAALSSSRFEIGDVLEIVFGPLHNAVTSDRLPRELWKQLGHVTPEAGDPALRLRRLLIEVARKQRWPSERILRAIDGAGPFVSELRRDIERSDDHNDEWWIEAAKAVVRVVGWPFR
jgi:hypothetical protein